MRNRSFVDSALVLFVAVYLEQIWRSLYLSLDQTISCQVLGVSMEIAGNFLSQPKHATIQNATIILYS